MSCKHRNTHQIGPTRCYGGGVAVYPYTDENQAAHGDICYDEECLACGAQRSVNVNGPHVEVSPWDPTRAQREEEARAGTENSSPQLLKKRGIIVIGQARNGSLVLVERDGYREWLQPGLIRALLRSFPRHDDAEVWQAILVVGALAPEVRP